MGKAKNEYVVTAKVILQSKRVSASRAQELVRKVRAKGGTATVRKV